LESADDVTALDRRFVLTTAEVALMGGAVTLTKPRSADDLLSEADFERDERLPYWADIWPSSTALAGVVVHESRRHFPADQALLEGLPVHRIERAAVDAAAWSRSARTAVGLLAAVVQQRLSTPARLAEALETAGKVRHHRVLALALGDISGGSQSLAEIDFVRFCRTHDLPEPDRQARRKDARGRWRYLDVEWRLPAGRVLVVEIDGIGHLEATRWYDDLLRTAELPPDDGRTLIRLPATAVRLDGLRVAAILRAHLVPA